MEPSDREWQQLQSTLISLDVRVSDVRDRLTRLEVKVQTLIENTKDTKHSADTYQVQLMNIEKEITKYKTAWKVIATIAALLGVLIGWAVEFFKPR